MKIKNTLIVLFAVFVLVSCLPAASFFPTRTAAPLADNFAFVLYDKPCEINILDTTSGTLVHTPAGETKPITISLRLTDNELEAIYQKALAVDFFRLPAKILAPNGPNQMWVSPSGTYKLSMTNGTTSNSVTWTSDIITDPLFREAADFMELVHFIREAIKTHPEFRQLPEPRAACL